MGLKSYFSNKFFSGSEQSITERASKSVTDDNYYSYLHGKTDGNPAPQGLSVLLDLYEKDPIVNTAINVRTNSILQSGYTLEGSKTAVSKDTVKLEKAGFNYTFQDKLVKNGLLFNHVFIEIVGKGKELHLLDPSEMEIKHDSHGEISGYQQRAPNGEVIPFLKEEIIYIPFNKVTNKVWGSVNLKSLFRTATTKNLIEEFINQLASSNAWRQVFITKTMQKENIGEFLAYMRDASKDPSMPLVMKKGQSADKDDGIFELLRDPADLKEFLGTLDYLRAQMLMELRTPPILVGLPDSSNRSSSDSQFKSFNIDNQAFRTLLSEAFNNHLFKAMGLTSEYVWNPLDKRDEKEDIEIAEKLMNMGAKPKQVEAFLRKSGLDLPEGELFDPKPEVEMSTPDESRPSRRREDKNADMKEQKTGADSSTKASQLEGA